MPRRRKYDRRERSTRAVSADLSRVCRTNALVTLAAMGQSIPDPLLALDEARDHFARSQDLTLAIEEEFQIVDPETHDLVNRFAELKARTDAIPLGEHTAGELISSEIEVKTGRCESFPEAARSAGRAPARACSTRPRRSASRSRPAGRTPGRRGGSRRSSTRPTTASSRTRCATSPGATTRSGSTSTSACATPTAPSRSTTRMRSVLPDLLALSASSPWYEGRYTYLHSTRTQLFTRMFPRCGIPEPFDGWADYDRFVRWLVETRLDQGAHRDLVVRAAAPVVRHGRAAQRRRAGRRARVAGRDGLRLRTLGPPPAGDRRGRADAVELRGRHIEENMWRAIRWGLSGELIDYERGMRSVPAAERMRAQLADAAPEIAALGLEPYLEPLHRMLEHGNSAQRSIAALEAGRDARGAVRGAGARDARVGRRRRSHRRRPVAEDPSGAITTTMPARRSAAQLLQLARRATCSRRRP